MGRVRRLRDLVEDLVAGSAGDEGLEFARTELDRAWAEVASRLEPDAVVLVTPAPIQRLEDPSWGVVMYERVPPVDVDDPLGWWSSYRLSLHLHVADTTRWTYLARGMLAATPGPGERAASRPGPLVLHDVYVWEEYQGRGLGARLMREMIGRARRVGFRSIEGTIAPRPPCTEEYLIRFYRHLGFDVDAAGQRMRLELAPTA